MSMALSHNSPATSLRSPVLYWTEVSAPSGPVRDLVERIKGEILAPMLASQDEVEWVEQMEARHEDWLRLRLELVLSVLPELELGEVEALNEEATQLPITLLPATAYVAARYAIELMAWLSNRLIRAATRRAPVDLRRMKELIEVMATVELCWLTLLGNPRPIPEVAEAAAWEAYSYTRPLAELMLSLGLDTRDMPAESPDEAVVRAEAMLKRLSQRA